MTYYDDGRVVVRDSVDGDIEAMGNLREKDEREVVAAGHHSGSSALVFSRRGSVVSLTLVLDGVPLAMFGVAPRSVLAEDAQVWLLGTPGLERMKKTFVRLSRRFVGEFLDLYPVLWNFIDARYVETVRWLEALGARTEATVPYGPGGIPFHLMVLRRQ